MTQIHCPHCNKAINIEDALAHDLTVQFQAKLADERKLVEADAADKLAKEMAEFKNTLTKQLEDHYRSDLESLRDQEESRSKELQSLREQELTVRKEKLRLEQLQKSTELEVQRKLDEGRKSIEEKARQEERQHIAVQHKHQEQTLGSLREQLESFKARELELLKEKQRLEDLQQSVDLDVQRKLDEERKSIAEKARLQEREQNVLQLKQKDQTLDALREQLEEMKRKAEQGSQQAQGEVQEVELESILKDLFPLDAIHEVHKGVNGADIVHTIMSTGGKRCGSISIESKRTKSFSDRWIEKLKEDMLRHGCELGVVVTETMPEGQAHIIQIERNIWICPFAEFKGLALLLRDSLLRVEAVKTVQGNSTDKMKLLYDYLTSPEFRQQLEIIFGGFRALEENFAKERRAMQKLWKEREKQLNKVYTNALDFYGSISGIAGADVPTVEALELDSSVQLPMPEHEDEEA